MNLNWEQDSAAHFNARVGHTAAVYVQFVRFPFERGELDSLNGFVDQVAAQRGMALLTLEPLDGLEAVTAEAATDLAERLAAVNARGVPVLLRYAHEMNGSWYPWAQRPQSYVDSFRLVADAVHTNAPLTAMLWAPNYGSGYPYSGGVHGVRPGTVDFERLDTNHDGTLDMHDDPYGPYYPGDDTVDWVGMSIYHWGYEYPWGENVVPEPDKLLAQLAGSYTTPNSDETSLPNFYRVYAEARGKPMAIPETAAFYRPGAGGADELEIKQTWMQQVFGPDLSREFPRIKLVNWFEWSKYESEVGDLVDWRISFEPGLIDLAHALLAAGQWLSADDLPRTMR